MTEHTLLLHHQNRLDALAIQSEEALIEASYSDEMAPIENISENPLTTLFYSVVSTIASWQFFSSNKIDSSLQTMGNRLLRDMVRDMAEHQKRWIRECSEQRQLAEHLDRKERKKTEIKKEEERKQQARLDIQRIEEPKLQQRRLEIQKIESAKTSLERFR